MSPPDAYVTIYCDEPSHTDTPIGLFLKGSWLETHDILEKAVLSENTVKRGVFIVTTMQRGRSGEGLWTPAEFMWGTPSFRPTRPRRGGGFQWVPDADASPEMVAEFAERNFPPVRARFLGKCDRCDLSFTRRWPAMVETLETLTAAGITAISLRGLIDTT